MDPAEFDKFAVEYRDQHAQNIRLSGESPEYFAEYKVADLRELFGRERAAADGIRILDFGGGIGNSVPFLRSYFPSSEIVCLDVSEESLKVAKSRFPAQAEYVRFDGRCIPYDGESFDAIIAACVFHHIPEPLQHGLLGEICRVLKNDGIFTVFEHNPWNPLTVKVVRDCVFDENAVLITAPEMSRRLRHVGFVRRETRYRVFYPGALAFLRPTEALLTKVPLGGQYSVAAFKRV